MVAAGAALLGISRGLGLPFFGQSATAPPLPPDTVTVTEAPRRTSTRPIVVILPTHTPPPTRIPRRDTATPTETSRPTATPTVTPPPTQTTAPADTPTLIGASTVLLQLTPDSVTAGRSVSGSGWPDNALVTLTVDTGVGVQTLGFVTAADGSFQTTLSVPGAVAPGTYTIVASDAAGDSTSQMLTVTGRWPGWLGGS